MPTGAHLLGAFAGAAALGAVVGLERQSGDDETTGSRTFAMYAAWGTAAGLVGAAYGGVAFAAVALAFAALVTSSYLADLRDTGDRGTTTEAAGFVVFAIGVLAHEGEWIVAVALAVGTAMTLGAKPAIHTLAHRLSPDDRRVALQFIAMTGVVLPLVPDEPMGPYGALNPHRIWLMVVLVSGIGLIGYLALRLIGSRWLGFTGLVGGLVSSTAVTLGFSRISRAQPDLRSVLAGGILGASALMFPRAVVEAAVLSPDLGWAIGRVLVPLGVVVGLVAFRYLRVPAPEAAPGTERVEIKNPLSLPVALQFGAFYGVIVLLAEALVDRVSEASLVWVGAASGITDIDAITLAMANLVEDGFDLGTGTQTVLVAIAVNTAVKGLLVVGLAGPTLRRVVSLTLFPAAAVTAIAALLV